MSYGQGGPDSWAKPITVRLNQREHGQLEALEQSAPLKKLLGKRDWERMSRTDVVRALIALGVAAERKTTDGSNSPAEDPPAPSYGSSSSRPRKTGVDARKTRRGGRS